MRTMSFVYQYINDSGTPWYIGMVNGDSFQSLINRVDQHTKDPWWSPELKIIFADGFSKEEAAVLEASLINFNRGTIKNRVYEDVSNVMKRFGGYINIPPYSWKDYQSEFDQYMESLPQKEIERYLTDRRTQGRKGIKMPRINMAFTPEVHDYIRTMAQARGQTITQFTEDVFRKSMESNAEAYALSRRLCETLNH